MSQKYARLVQTSVTNFLFCGDEYLFVKRAADKKVDAGRLNGIGGKLEPGEDYLSCAIRETEEETGYVVQPEDCRLCGVVKLEGGYEEDWVMCFFAIEVPHMKIPVGLKTDEGEFMWIDKKEVLNCQIEAVDDLQYLWKHIVSKNKQFFMTAQMNSREKIDTYSLRFTMVGNEGTISDPGPFRITR